MTTLGFGVVPHGERTASGIPDDPRVVVVVPALNEAPTIGALVAETLTLGARFPRLSVLVVDDGSDDGTADLARKAGAEVVRHRRNRGLGAAFGTGLAGALWAGADIIVTMDGDGQFDPADIPALLEPVLAGAADVTTCTRFADPARIPSMPGIKLWGNRVMARLVNALTGRDHTDVSCGFRAYSREAALHLTLFGRYTYTQETFIHLAEKDFDIVEVPLSVRGVREHGESRVAASVVRYGFNTASILFRAVRDLRPLAFFGSGGLLSLLLGSGLVLFVFVHWLQTGRTHPYQSLLLGGGTFVLMGVLLLVLALLADMVGRVFRVVDQMLYHQRTLLLDDARRGASDAEG